jgi:hypothetical protein
MKALRSWRSFSVVALLIMATSCVHSPDHAVEALTKDRAISAARDILGPQHGKDPVRIVESQACWDIYFPVSNALSVTQVIVDKKSGLAKVGVTR